MNTETLTRKLCLGLINQQSKKSLLDLASIRYARELQDYDLRDLAHAIRTNGFYDFGNDAHLEEYLECALEEYADDADPIASLLEDLIASGKY